MQRINRGIDTTMAGTVRQLRIAGLFSLLFLLATVTYAQGACTDCHYPGGIGPLPHNVGCTDTSCAQACHPSQDVNMHPTSVYTPWGGGTADRTTICRACHDKPWPDVYHPYTINVSAGSITPPGSVDLDKACGQCHGGGTDNVASPPKKTPDGLYDYPYYNKTTLGAFATSIHVYKPMPTATFTAAYDPVTSYKVNFDASASTCPAEVAPCAYAWDFTNDGTNDASGITATNTYGGASSQTVKLTVTDSIFRTATTTRSVTPQLVNLPPVAAFTLAQTGPAVTVTNTSTDENVATVKFYLTWGDGTSEPIRTGKTNPTFTHTYAAAGTFTITLLATDSAAAANSASTPVTVTTATYTIGGTVTAGPAGASNVNSVLLTLKKGTTVVANTYTGATGAGPFSYSFTGLAPATNYTVTATKTGAVFSETNPTAAITVGPDSASNNFTTVKTKFSITSTAKGSGGANLSGVTIIVKNSAGTLVAQGTTNTSGVYATNMTLPAGAYTVTASKVGRAFSNTPQTITFVNGNADGSLTFNSTTP